MESRDLLNLSVQNILICISENFNLKNFRWGARARNSLEQCATRSPNGLYRVHITTVYYISRSPLSQNPSVAPYLSSGFFIFFSASHSVNYIGLKRYRFSPLLWWGWRTCSHTLQITTDRGMVLVVHPMANELFQKNMLRPKDWTRSPLTFVHVMHVSQNLSWREADSMVLGDVCGGIRAIRPLSEEVPCIWLYILDVLYSSQQDGARNTTRCQWPPLLESTGYRLPIWCLIWSGAFWGTILRNVTVAFISIFHSWSRSDRYNTPCSLSYSVLRQEYLPHVHWPRRVWMIFPI